MKQYTVIGYYDADDFNLGGMAYRATVEANDQWGAFEKVAGLGIKNLILVCAVEGVHEIHTPTEGGETCAAQDYPGWPDCCVSGYHFPTTLDGDASRQWVTRCDECEIFESDEEAAKYAANALGLKAEEHDNPNKDYAAKAWSLEEV